MQQCSNVMWVRAEALEGLSIMKVGTIDDDDYMNNLGALKAEVYCKNMWKWEKPIDGAHVSQTMPS